VETLNALKISALEMHLMSPFERKVTEGLTNPDAQEHVPSASSIALISPQD
jgi:hypothetical protein